MLKIQCCVQEQPINMGEKLNRPALVYDVVKDIETASQEMFLVLTLDNSNRLIGRYMVSLGTVNQALVHPRDVFRPAIQDNAASVMLAHNHPSGSEEFSAQDRGLTIRMKEAGELLGIQVLDHILVPNGGQFQSYMDCYGM